MAKARILVVDDDADITIALQAILESQDYEVSVASNKSEGKEKLTAEKPDLLILDVMMEAWQDGFELAREVKQDPEVKDIPILMLTAVEGKTGIEFKTTAGDPDWLPVDGFLDKPVEPQTLLAEVEKILSKNA
ncbi:MAG TPA: response regulator [Phycisphaerales bacterium]|nr:response regulator [Phycisphaerales bacterium]